MHIFCFLDFLTIAPSMTNLSLLVNVLKLLTFSCTFFVSSVFNSTSVIYCASYKDKKSNL